MKKPEEIKKGLDVIQKKLKTFDQRESTMSQVSKALLSKENATLDEVLKAVSQLKTTLEMAQAERDAINRDRIRLMERVAELEKENKALLHDLRLAGRFDCGFCKHHDWTCTHEDCENCSAPCPCRSCRKRSNYVWRGVCEANSKGE